MVSASTSFPRRAYPPQITPKMCLLEWCRREKLAQPVYETVSFCLWPALQPATVLFSLVPSPQQTYCLYP
jgi:hypothetical protein